MGKPRNPHNSSGDNNIPPPSMPEIPAPLPSGDYSYSIEAVLGMQKSIGQLEAKVDMLVQQSGDMGKRMHRLEIAVYSSLAVMAIIGWFVNKAIDIAMSLKK